jgi:hypothetical protein
MLITMNNFSLNVALVIDTFNDELRKMINAKITRLDGLLAHRAPQEHVLATNGTITVPAFYAVVSQNQREINAFFTTDAFTVFSGPVNIEFGYGGEVLGVFENFDPTGDIDPLAPVFDGITAPDADNDWLEQILNP